MDNNKFNSLAGLYLNIDHILVWKSKLIETILDSLNKLSILSNNSQS